MRSFSRKADPGDRSVVDLRSVCDKAMLIFRHLDGYEVAAEICDDPVWVQGNANQLQQVVVNLIQNAVDADEEGSPVRVKVFRDGDDGCVAVEDNGEGIPQSAREHIFEPFFTTKPEGKGTGLGLAISHTIMREHGGVLRINDDYTEGTRFEMRLPHHDPDKAQKVRPAGTRQPTRPVELG